MLELDPVYRLYTDLAMKIRALEIANKGIFDSNISKLLPFKKPPKNSLIFIPLKMAKLRRENYSQDAKTNGKLLALL